MLGLKLNHVSKRGYWWRHDMETFSALLAGFSWANPGPVMRNFYVFFVVNLNMMLNKHSSWWWFSAPCRSCDVTVMHSLSRVLREELDIQGADGHIYRGRVFDNRLPLIQSAGPVSYTSTLLISQFLDVFKWNFFDRKMLSLMHISFSVSLNCYLSGPNIIVKTPYYPYCCSLFISSFLTKHFS